MKILNIGDVHGYNKWKDFVKNHSDFDLIVFVGDYTDSFDFSNEQIKQNLLDIIEFKKSYPEKVILLYGNHDIPYALFHPTVEMEHGCTGYRPDMHFDLYDIFQENKKLFQLAYQHNNYIWTHAGISRGWYEEFVRQFKKIFDDFDGNIADKLNLALQYELDVVFYCGWIRGGSKKVGGPLWADKTETWKKPLKNYHQICGHTKIDDIKKVEYNKFDCSVTYIDVKDKCYIIEI